MLVRVIAAALISWALVEFALYFVISEHNHTPVNYWPCFLRALPLLAGVAMLIKARAIAEWFADKLDL